MKVKLRSLLSKNKKKASTKGGGGSSKLLDGVTVGIVEHTSWKHDSDDIISDGASPVDTSIETTLDSVTDMLSIDDSNDSGSNKDIDSNEDNEHNLRLLGSERTVLFHSQNLGIQLHRGTDGHVRVKSLTPTSNRHTTGTIRTGDVILEMAGVDIRTPIDAATWSKAVTRTKEAARPVTFVVAEELTGHAAEEMYPGDVTRDAVSGDAISEADVSGDDDSADSATSAKKNTTNTTTKTITKTVMPTREIEADLLAEAVSTSAGSRTSHTSKEKEEEEEEEEEEEDDDDKKKNEQAEAEKKKRQQLEEWYQEEKARLLGVDYEESIEMDVGELQKMLKMDGAAAHAIADGEAPGMQQEEKEEGPNEEEKEKKDIQKENEAAPSTKEGAGRIPSDLSSIASNKSTGSVENEEVTAASSTTKEETERVLASAKAEAAWAAQWKQAANKNGTRFSSVGFDGNDGNDGNDDDANIVQLNRINTAMLERINNANRPPKQQTMKMTAREITGVSTVTGVSAATGLTASSVEGDTASDVGDTNSIISGEDGDFFTEDDYKNCNSMIDRIDDVACSGFVCSDLPEKVLGYEDFDELEEDEG